MFAAGGGPSWLGDISGIALLAGGAVEGLKGIISTARAAIQGAGWLANIVAKGVMATVAVAFQGAQGWVGALEAAAKAFAGAALDNLALGIASFLAAAGLTVLGVFSIDVSIPIWDWCGENAGQCGSEPQYIFT